MAERRHSFLAPLILAVVLLLHVAYVGSYLALVTPRNYFSIRGEEGGLITDVRDYRYGGERVAWFFWPLEQIDRKLRPKVWEPWDD